MSAAESFWQNRRVLVTGHTGFKGAWLGLMLRSLDADVTGFALAPDTRPNLVSLLDEGSRSIIGDIRNAELLQHSVSASDPQVVIHMAAQALVRESYQDPVGTFATNVIGTANLLQACRALRHLECILVVTSDKVYENDGRGHPFSEQDRLGGHDPYSNSKACAELLTASFRDSFFSPGPPVATVRAGNVIGGGDWSQDRLVPDCIRAIDAGAPVSLRYPDAVRPWQHVLEPLSGYLALAEALVNSPVSAPRAVNFGPNPASFCTVSAVVDALSASFGGRPGWVPDGGLHPPEAPALTLTSALAERTLKWRTKLGFAQTLSWTADWYQAHRAGENMLHYSQNQLAEYRRLA